MKGLRGTSQLIMACYKKNSSLAPGTLPNKMQNYYLKMPLLNLRDIRRNTALFEFDLAKFDIRQLPQPKMKFPKDFLEISKYFRFHPLVIQAPFTRWVNNKLK